MLLPWIWNAFWFLCHFQEFVKAIKINQSTLYHCFRNSTQNIIYLIENIYLHPGESTSPEVFFWPRGEKSACSQLLSVQLLCRNLNKHNSKDIRVMMSSYILSVLWSPTENTITIYLNIKLHIVLTKRERYYWEFLKTGRCRSYIIIVNFLPYIIWFVVRDVLIFFFRH